MFFAQALFIPMTYFLAVVIAIPSDTHIRSLFERDLEVEFDGGLHPRSWSEGADNIGGMLHHLSDDGVLRRLKLRAPKNVVRDEHIKLAKYEVLDARPLPPALIKKWIDLWVERHPQKREYLETTFANIDGRNVHPRDLFEPDSKMVPRASHTIAEVREFQARAVSQQMNPLLNVRSNCHGDCHLFDNCMGNAGPRHRCSCGMVDNMKDKECYARQIS